MLKAAQVVFDEAELAARTELDRVELDAAEAARRAHEEAREVGRGVLAWRRTHKEGADVCLCIYNILFERATS